VTQLQEKVLGFIDILHKSETDRKTLKQQAEALKQQAASLQKYKERARELERNIASLEEQVRYTWRALTVSMSISP